MLTVSNGSTNRIQRIQRILGRFDPMRGVSHNAQHLAMCSISSEALHMAEELNKIKVQLSTGVTVIGREHTRIDKTVEALEQETPGVQKEFAARVA